MLLCNGFISILLKHGAWGLSFVFAWLLYHISITWYSLQMWEITLTCYFLQEDEYPTVYGKKSTYTAPLNYLKDLANDDKVRLYLIPKTNNCHIFRLKTKYRCMYWCVYNQVESLLLQILHKNMDVSLNAVVEVISL